MDRDRNLKPGERVRHLGSWSGEHTPVTVVCDRGDEVSVRFPGTAWPVTVDKASLREL